MKILKIDMRNYLSMHSKMKIRDSSFRKLILYTAQKVNILTKNEQIERWQLECLNLDINLS